MADYSWLAPRFGVLDTLVTSALVGYLVLVEPVRMRRRLRRLIAQRDTDPRGLWRYYRATCTAYFVGTALVGLAVVVAPGLDRQDVGLVLPNGPSAREAITVGAYVTVLVLFGAWRFRRALNGGRARQVPGIGTLAQMTPRTAGERVGAVGLAVCAGVGEELVFRGLFIAAGIGLVGLSPLLSAVVSGLLFVLAHSYQGARGMLGVAVVTVLFTQAYFASRSLLLPMFVHALFDVRVLLVLPPPRPVAAHLAADD